MNVRHLGGKPKSSNDGMIDRIERIEPNARTHAIGLNAPLIVSRIRAFITVELFVESILAVNHTSPECFSSQNAIH